MLPRTTSWNPAPTGWSRYGNTVVGPPGDDWTWVRGGVWTHRIPNARIGLVSMGATDQVTTPITAEFADVRVYSVGGGNRPHR